MCIDASKFAFGVMLSQNLDNIIDRPIILCKYNVEKSYTTTKK